jgi:nitrate reductase delta subunit
MLDAWQDDWNRLEEDYVKTFDLSEVASLYLTAHEFGDSRDRGAALIQLAQLFSDVGYGLALGELPDYLPLLIELLAVRPDSVGKELKDRVAAVAQQILQVLTDEHPYRPLFGMLIGVLGNGGSGLATDVGENPDLEDLPFPLEFT